MKQIGPTFGDELKAAGIDGEGLSWGTDGDIQFRDDVPQATRDAVAAVYAAHDPVKSAARLNILQQLAEIDRQTIAAARGLREFVLAQSQVTDYVAPGNPTPIPNFQPFAQNVGVQKIATAEALAVQLRAQLKALGG